MFHLAKECADLSVHLSGSMGKRTKYQQEEHAQLYLFAKSNFMTQSADIESSLSLGNSQQNEIGHMLNEADQIHLDSTKEVWQHAQWELGRRLVGEALNGEEAAVREVKFILLIFLCTWSSSSCSRAGFIGFYGRWTTGKYSTGGELLLILLY